MSQSPKALVLTLAANPSPLLIKINPETAADLGPRLIQMVRNGHTQSITATDGSEFAINFSHVVAAHLE